jgi:hypothetical protein
MIEIATETVGPMAPIAERLGKEGLRERGPRSRRQPASAPQPEFTDQSETTPHQVDSLA